MATMAPPDEIQKERFARIDERFDEVNRRITEGREETRQRFDRLEGETSLRFGRVEGDIVELKKGVAGVQATLNRICIGLALGFATVLGTVLAKSF